MTPSLLIVTNVYEAAGPFKMPVTRFNPHAVTMHEHVLTLITAMQFLLAMCVVTHVFTGAASERGYTKTMIVETLSPFNELMQFIREVVC